MFVLQWRSWMFSDTWCWTEAQSTCCVRRTHCRSRCTCYLRHLLYMSACLVCFHLEEVMFNLFVWLSSGQSVLRSVCPIKFVMPSNLHWKPFHTFAKLWGSYWPHIKSKLHNEKKLFGWLPAWLTLTDHTEEWVRLACDRKETQVFPFVPLHFCYWYEGNVRPLQERQWKWSQWSWIWLGITNFHNVQRTANSLIIWLNKITNICKKTNCLNT